MKFKVVLDKERRKGCRQCALIRSGDAIEIEVEDD